MKHLKPINLTKSVFTEYKLEYIDPKDGPDTLLHYKLTSILKFIRNNSIVKYTISGFRNGEWEVMIRH